MCRNHSTCRHVAGSPSDPNNLPAHAGGPLLDDLMPPAIVVYVLEKGLQVTADAKVQHLRGEVISTSAE